jgi:hypothetical protein
MSRAVSTPPWVITRFPLSKTLQNHRFAIALFVCAYNFCKVHSTMGCTPAVAVKLAGETWTIEKLIAEASK